MINILLCQNRQSHHCTKLLNSYPLIILHVQYTWLCIYIYIININTYLLLCTTLYTPGNNYRTRSDLVIAHIWSNHKLQCSRASKRPVFRDGMLGIVPINISVLVSCLLVASLSPEHLFLCMTWWLLLRTKYHRGAQYRSHAECDMGFYQAFPTASTLVNTKLIRLKAKYP